MDRWQVTDTEMHRRVEDPGHAANGTRTAGTLGVQSPVPSPQQVQVGCSDPPQTWGRRHHGKLHAMDPVSDEGKEFESKTLYLAKLLSDCEGTMSARPGRRHRGTPSVDTPREAPRRQTVVPSGTHHCPPSSEALPCGLAASSLPGEARTPGAQCFA